jgi:hypothetical protein
MEMNFIKICPEIALKYFFEKMWFYMKYILDLSFMLINVSRLAVDRWFSSGSSAIKTCNGKRSEIVSIGGEIDYFIDYGKKYCS